MIGTGSPARTPAETPPVVAESFDVPLSSLTTLRLGGPARRVVTCRSDAALIEAVQDLQPDVLLLQEAPRFVLPTARLRWFARQIDRRILLGGAGGRGLAILATDEVAAQVIRRGAHPVAQGGLVGVDAHGTLPNVRWEQQ